MIPSTRLSLSVTLCLALGFLAFGGIFQSQGAEKQPAKAPAKKAAAPPKPLEIVATKSVFSVPTNPKDGRNPFYPKSQIAATVPKESVKSIEISAFVLNGITGPPRRSAMINGRTFLPGEEGEVRLQNGAKVLIKCTEIRDESAIITVGGTQRELRMRMGI